MPKQPVHPFAPSTTTPSVSSPRDSKRDVTVPFLPELQDPNFLDRLLPPPAVVPSVKPKVDAQPLQGAEFMAALTKVSNRTRTTNQAPGFASTLDPTLDAFDGLSQQTNWNDIKPLTTLRRSYERDPVTTVKIIFNLRSIHEGKSEREGFYRAWGWLYREHPRTAIANLPALVEPLIERKRREKKDGHGAPNGDDEEAVLVDLLDEPPEDVPVRGLSHGYWKDLLNLLVLAMEGELDANGVEFQSLHNGGYLKKGAGRGGRYVARQRKGKQEPDTKDARTQAGLARDAEVSNVAQKARDEKHAGWRSQVEKLFTGSPSFKALYIQVARLFAEGLANDIQLLKKIADPKTPDQERLEASFQISLCGKYAPSIGGSHDRKTNIASAIAELLWMAGHLRDPPGQHSPGPVLPLSQVQDLRCVYTRWVVSPLRRFLQIPELYMSSNLWGELPYQRVPSTCMQRNKGLFQKHDRLRFSQYLKDVATGRKTISGGTLLPHSLLWEAIQSTDDIDKAVIEGQWNTLIETLKASGALDNCLAVCDVSGSMGNILDGMFGSEPQPILPAVALSLVLAQIARPPWVHTFITFSETPQIERIHPEEGLAQTALRMCRADWGSNTDFNAVFTKLLLPLAVEAKLPKEEMIKRLFVFSDMQFDESYRDTLGEGKWQTEHQKAVEAFREAGYDMPEIVYWNLAGGELAKPVTAAEEGVAIMSGFSANMLKVFMEGGAIEQEEELQLEMVVVAEGQAMGEVGEDDIELVSVEDAVSDVVTRPAAPVEPSADPQEGDMVVVTTAQPSLTLFNVMKKALDRPSYATLVVLD